MVFVIASWSGSEEISVCVCEVKRRKNVNIKRIESKRKETSL
jgi:hypothetical protein